MVMAKLTLRASLATSFFYGIFNFPNENELISHGKMKNPWEIVVPKPALIENCFLLNLKGNISSLGHKHLCTSALLVRT
jgi:hypothetical protein